MNRFDWITHERERLFAEAARKDAEALDAERRHINEIFESAPVVGAAAGAGNISPGSAPAFPDNPLARLARKRARQRTIYQIGTGLLIAALVAAFAGAIFTQVNAARLDWPEIQERTKW